MTTIKLKNGSGAPLAGDLVQGEPALDLTNKRLYTEDSGGTVIEVGTNPTSLTTGTFTSTGIDDNAASTAITIDGSQNVGIGTSSPTAYSGQTNLNINSAGVSRIDFDISDALQGYVLSESGYIALYANTGNYLSLGSNNTEAMRIDSSGFVGIGTASPSVRLEIKDGANTFGTDFRLSQSYNSAYSSIASNFGGSLTFDAGVGAGTPTLHFKTNGTERMRIDSSGNVNIGVSSGAGTLTIASSGNTGLILRQNTAVDRFKFFVGDGTGGYVADENFISSNNTNLRFLAGGSGTTEVMQLTNSGNLLVGRTSVGTTGTGHSIRGGDSAVFARAGGEVAIFSRSDSEGQILRFDSNGSAGVGSIGASGGVVYVTGPVAGGLKYSNYDSTHASIFPCTTTGGIADNLHDMGYAGSRFDDIYATNGTIQTSDRNEKQDIEALSDAEQRVAVAAKGLLRKFRWIDSVEEKGDDARIHFGIIAQDLQDAFTAEGLDAGRYAMFISSTWWESTEVIPAVEAQEAVVDEEGNVVEEAVEAQEERTVVHTHQTAEEAPEGSVERTRLGVRYSELLAFIIAAI